MTLTKTISIHVYYNLYIVCISEMQRDYLFHKWTDPCFWILYINHRYVQHRRDIVIFNFAHIQQSQLIWTILEDCSVPVTSRTKTITNNKHRCCPTVLCDVPKNISDEIKYATCIANKIINSRILRYLFQWQHFHYRLREFTDDSKTEAKESLTSSYIQVLILQE